MKVTLASPPAPKAPRWPLWSLLWRMVVLGPILAPLGLLMFSAVVTTLVLPPIYAIGLGSEGRYFDGFSVLLLWFGWLRWGLRLFKWMLRGIEYASL